MQPVLWIGQAGASEAVCAEADQLLETHELVKVKVRAGDRSLRAETLQELTTRTGAQLVQRIGNVAVLYRRNREPLPRVILPQT